MMMASAPHAQARFLTTFICEDDLRSLKSVEPLSLEIKRTDSNSCSTSARDA
jgi:hypothetical protein